jgi:putative N6-adenine-specific DNA methylase
LDASPDIRTYFAACTLGLEPAVSQELRSLGVRDAVEKRGGVAFRGDRRIGYAANLWVRSAVYVQERILEGPAHSPEELYTRVSEVDWGSYMSLDQTLAVDAAVRDSGITHSLHAALTVKDAIVDQFRERLGKRPNVDTEAPDLPLKLLVRRDVATLYRNLSGTSLHRRGWRPIQVKSPLNEAIAAGLLILSEWDRASPLVDPMCGSGTFVIEAACLAADRAPGLLRVFPFECWPDFDAEAWQELRADAERRAKDTLPFVLEGADRHAGALDLARKGARAAGVEKMTRFTVAEATRFVPAQRPMMVAVNPPWGMRLGAGEDLVESWRALGNFMHSRCGGAVAHVLSGNAELTRHLGLRASRKHVVMNGPIECRWIRYEVRGASATQGGGAGEPG